MEVAAILNKARGVLDCNVYGVQVDSAEGKAGMATMSVSKDFSFDSFTNHVNENLNTFQKPYFLRLSKNMKTTGTFKHQKEDLKKQGFNPELIEDKLFFYQNSSYVEIDSFLYNRIQSGEERFWSLRLLEILLLEEPLLINSGIKLWICFQIMKTSN